jgi:GntR family transcriptional regulator, trigonelline degradation regulator
MLGTMQVQRHAPIREQVAALLRDAIIDMRLAPGELLIERELCEMTSASRPSVREALRQLEAEGLVQSQNGRGTFVSVVSPEVAREVYEVRAELEGLAAELFANRASADERADLRAAVEAMAVIVEGEVHPEQAREIIAAKNALYDVLFRGASNPILHQTIETLQRRVNQLRALTLSHPGRPERSLAEIREILDAIEARDGAAARAAARDHVVSAARTVLGDAAVAPVG